MNLNDKEVKAIQVDGHEVEIKKIPFGVARTDSDSHDNRFAHGAALQNLYEQIGNMIFKEERLRNESGVIIDFKELLEIYLRAHLFHVDLSVYDFQDITSEMRKDFRLPFRETLLVLPKFFDSDENISVMVLAIETSPDNYDLYAFMFVKPCQLEASLSIFYVTLKIDRANGDTEIACYPPDELKPNNLEQFKNITYQIAVYLLVTVAYINQPIHYVIKESIPLTPREKKLIAKNKRPYFRKKPLHIVLNPSQVRHISPKNKDAHGTKKIPHSRRGHWRNLKHERYQNAQEKAIWIDCCDINRGEKWELHKRIYEVIRTANPEAITSPKKAA